MFRPRAEKLLCGGATGRNNIRVLIPSPANDLPSLTNIG